MRRWVFRAGQEEEGDEKEEELKNTANRGGQERSWKEDGAEVHGLEKLNVAWNSHLGKKVVQRQICPV